MQYNLIRNGYFTSLTASGTGNVDLTWAELEFLMDGNLTSSGVSVTSPGVLCLETDLSQRIKVGGIRLYTSDLSKSTNIKFYYKNAESDSYTTSTTHSGASYYYTTIDSPSAPQFIRVTVSGVDMDIYEFQVFNDDYIVSFGQDGSQYAEYLDNTPVGEIGAVESIAIYNNSTSPMPANAYTCIDYTGNEADYYIEISSNESGPFYDLTDGIMLEDNLDNSIYTWNMGSFSDTTIDANRVALSSTPGFGTYITPIFGLDDSNKASYFLAEETTDAQSSISYDENSYNGTIRIKSSNTKPMMVNKVLWSRSGDQYVDVKDVYTGDVNDNVIRVYDSIAHDIKNIAVNRHNGRIAVSVYQNNTDDHSYIYVYNYNYSFIDDISTSYSDNNGRYVFNVAMDFDNDNGIWGYGTISYTGYTGSRYFLVRINNNYDNDSCSIYTGSNFLYDLAVEWDGTGVWYTDKIENVLKHVDYQGNLINSTILNSPRGICATADNGCWVSDNTDAKIYRYGESGSLIDSIEYTSLDISDITKMVKDFDSGFWFFNGDGVGHINDNNQKDLFIDAINISRIRAGHKCCIIYSYTNDDVKFIDLDAGAVISTWNAGNTNSQVPGLMSFSYEDYKDNHNPSSIIPISYDPVWGTAGSAEWREVRKDGYFLPKYKYHQLEYTLRSDVAGHNPSLNKVILAPAVETSDIQPSNYKNMYVRTNIPVGTDIADYETKLKTWWGVQE